MDETDRGEGPNILWTANLSSRQGGNKAKYNRNYCKSEGSKGRGEAGNHQALDNGKLWSKQDPLGKGLILMSEGGAGTVTIVGKGPKEEGVFT